MNNSVHSFQKKEYRVLLIDDHLGNHTTAGFLQYKLQEALNEDKNKEEIKQKFGNIYDGIKIIIAPEKQLDNFEFRLKSEPFDFVLLDLNFQYDIYCPPYKKDPKFKCTKVLPDNKDCHYCKTIDEKIKDISDKDKINLSSIYNEIGAYWLKYIVRPFNPSIPVIIFTSKFADSIEMASKYGLYGFNADYFEKKDLSKTLQKKEDSKDVQERIKNAYMKLLCKILENIRRYENAFFDKIEVAKSREEKELAAKNRDYMQSRLWTALVECISREGDDKDKVLKNRFAVVFFDFDGMKVVNEKLGYTEANVVIKNFAESISEYIKKKWQGIVSEEHQEILFYKPILGRYFRERGDEFLILFPSVIDKELESGGKKIGLHDFLENLRQEINAEEWQKKLLEGINSDASKKNISLTVSMGLFVFPDDLTIESQKKKKDLNELKNNNKEDFIKNISSIYSEISKIPQDLKDNAKALGKNQICYFQKERAFRNLKFSPRVNVGVVYNGSDAKELIEFLKYLTDELAFDFEILEKNENLNGVDVNYHLKLNIKNKENEIELSINDRPSEDSKPQSIKKWLLNKYNKEMHHKLIANISDIRSARKSIYDAISMLAKENGNEEYYPRFTVQNTIYNKFPDLKNDVVVFEKEPSREIVNEIKKSGDEDAKTLITYYENLKIKSPQGICAIRRISNKGGEDKYNIIVTIEVNDTAFSFLHMESGRNMAKLQQYFNGFLKGYLAVNPDKELITQLAELKYEMTDEGYNKYKDGGNSNIICRNPFFSPVSPNVYYEIIKPLRIRIDISLSRKDNETK